jgi:glycosyltransferase involved in cell wall biosynthesis
MSVLEAAAASKVIIATKTGSIPEMVEEGKNGYYIKYGSSEDVYEAANKILKSGKVNEMGAAGAQLVKSKFQIENSAQLYYNLYLGLVKK